MSLLLQLSAPVVEAAYTGSCATGGGSNTNSYIAHIYRTNYPSYDGISGQAYVRSLHTCTPTSLYGDLSLINLANVQAPGAFVQLGYALCRPPTGSGGCGHSIDPIPADGQPHFWWTCSDQSAGLPCLADGEDGLPAPVLNRQYVFKITGGNGSSWTFAIKDLTTNVWYQWNLISHDTGPSNEVWWGTEVSYANSAMGTNQGSPDLFMRRLQYHPVGGSWTTVTNQGIVYVFSTEGFWYPASTKEGGYWHAYTEESYYPYDTMQSHTHNH